MGGAATGYMGYMYPHSWYIIIDLDSSAGLNVMCSYAHIVQLKFRNMQSKRRNCAVNC